MLKERPNPPPLDWEHVPWEETPYKGVFIYKVVEESNPSDPNIPLFTIMALKLQPQAIILPHRHNRETGWTETITLPTGGWFETKNGQKSKEIKTKESLAIVIKAGDIFGLKNMDPLQPLYFFSTMKPGFTGYAEIEEIKQDADSPASKP